MKKLALLAIMAAIFSGCSISKTPEPANNMTPDENVQISEEKEASTGENDDMAAEQAPSYTDLSPEEAKLMIDNNPELIVIDVSPKWADGHLPRAINYYVGDGSLDRAIPGLDKNANYLVYCHVDSASILGSQKLVDAGFKNVYRLKGNYSAWVEAGYPTEK